MKCSNTKNAQQSRQAEKRGNEQSTETQTTLSCSIYNSCAQPNENDKNSKTSSDEQHVYATNTIFRNDDSILDWRKSVAFEIGESTYIVIHNRRS